MEVYLIRHTTPLLSPGLIYGRTDVPLTETFREECELVIANLPTDLDVVYSSPAKRCITLAGYISTEYITDYRLQEFNFGEWEGKTWDTVDQTQLQLWMDDFVNVTVPGGENMNLMFARLQEFWLELSRQSYNRVAIVTHAGVIRQLLALNRNIPLPQIFDIKVNYGEIIVELLSDIYRQ
jgi:alpha-ribazole phosphatase